MEVEFRTQELEYLYVTPLHAIKGKKDFGKEIIKRYKRKVEILLGITNITQLRQFRSLNFEFLKGDRRGECSVRLNDQYRLIFEQKSKDKIEILLVNEISKQYE